MKLFAKLIWMLSLCLIVFGFVSCKGGTNDGDGDKNGPSAVDDEVIYSPYVNTALILGDGVREADVKSIKNAYIKQTGKEIAVSTAADSPASHEIIIGKNDRELSQKAYRYLVALENENGYVGFVICSDGKSAAVAYNGESFGVNVAFNEALDFFVKTYMDKNTLKFNAGIVHYEIFDPITKQAERDETEIDVIWELKLAQLTEKMENEDDASALLAELKKLRRVFASNDNIAAWLANLYDPATGGFYYSNSARNNETFLPDLESTHQAIGLVELILTGYDGTITDYFGKEIADSFISFVVKMQAEDSGYFYHPQWPREAVDKNTERRDRDLIDAIGILQTFGASPRFDTPNGVKGSETVTPVSGLTTPLGKSVVKAVSSVVSVNEAPVSENEGYYIPPYLRTASEFSNYLSGLSINKNTAAACDKIVSEVTLYKTIDEYTASKGEKPYLIDTLKKTMSRYQLGNGLWSSSNNIYNDLSGLTSVVKVYNAMSEPLPSYIEIFSTAEMTLKFSLYSKNPPVSKITDISGPWAALSEVIDNLVSFTDESGSETLGWRMSSLYSSLISALTSTMDELGKFKRNDGSFSTTPNGDAYTAYNMPVALPGMSEGDMNATFHAAKTLWLSVFGVFDMGTVPIFTASDRMFFQKTLLDLGVVVKNETSTAEPIDFEKYEIGEPSDAGATLGDDSYLRVEKSPDREDKSLHFYSPAENKGGGKFEFNVTSSQANASCYVLDFDCYINDTVSSRMFSVIHAVRDVYLVAFVRNGDEIRLLEKAGNGYDVDYDHDVGVSIPMKQWFNIRVEFYPGTRETVRTKIYYNQECVSVSDLFRGKTSETGAPSKTFSSIQFHAYGAHTVDMFVDNLIIESTYKAYTPETGEINRNVDTPDSEQIKHDFEGTTLPSGMTVSGGLANATIAADPNNSENRVLKINEKADKVALPLNQRGVNINSALVEFDLTIDPSTAAGTIYQINFDEYGIDVYLKDRTFASMHILVREENGEKYAVIADTTTSGATANVYSAKKLELGKKYTVGFHLFFKELVVAAFVDGEMVGMSTGVMGAVNRGYMGETVLVAKTNSLTSIIYIDNLVSERVNVDFDKATAPAVDRADGSFDSNGNMTFNGVSPSGGTLPFNKPGYVKVPVNQRVSVPTLGLIGFDVTASAYGNLIIELQDESGNIIASLILKHNDNGVEIQELTALGQNHAPIHTVTNGSFNISVEYSSENESLNILVDGEYVAATSLIYTAGSCGGEFKYLVVKSALMTGFVIDNIYAETITAVFKGHSVSMENKDTTSEVVTFETSSFASLPGNMTYSANGADAGFKIKESTVYTDVSKVLSFNTGLSGGGLNINKTQSTPDKNASFFETDVKMDYIGQRMWLYFELQARTDSSFTAMAVWFTADNADDYITVQGGTDSKPDFKVVSGVKVGQWCKLRIEYIDTPYDFNYDGHIDCVYRVYINGTLIGEGNTPRTLGKVAPASSIINMRVRNSSGRYFEALFDNTVLGDCNMTYEKPADPDTDTVTYEQKVLNTNFVKYNAGTSASSYSFAESTIAGQATKVLNMHTANNSQDRLEIVPTKKLEGANAITFETDIMIKPESENAVIYFEPRNQSGNTAFRLVINAAKGGKVTISSADITEKEIGNTGEWIHIRVDYMNPLIDYTGDGRNDILYKVYVGDSIEPVAIGHQPYQIGGLYKPLDISKCVLTVTKESVGDILLDNTKLWQVELTPDKAPNFPEKDDFHYGSEGLDPDAWS